ncbi:MAG: ABC transporter permease subunit [Alphaproteobacteria bacterium]|nr:ABC transporter permease subunit [Alphaproteobacteria bacterium]
MAVLISAVTGARPAFEAFQQGLFLDSAAGTIVLVTLGAGAATLLGATAALLVTLMRFPGRSVFEWLLVAPLAAPAYALAYSYSSLTWAGGPVPAPLTGFVGAAFVYAVGFFPYVYLATRAALVAQSPSALGAARTLGAAPLRATLRIALPLARPGVAAGAALVAMEVAADYGAAVHFGVPTIATGIFRARGPFQDALLGNQMAAVLLIAALVFLWLERAARGRRKFVARDAHARPAEPFRAPWYAAGLATLFCAALVLFGALLPMSWLARLAMLNSNADLASLLRPLTNSVALAAIGAAATLALAILIARAARAGAVGRFAALFAASGYAAPGVVIALGALSVYGLARSLGWVGGLAAPAALLLLVWAYAARFTAPGAQPIEAGMARVTPGIAGAARTLGASAARRLWRIDLPLAGPSFVAAAIIVFVEILKELPATLLLRPLSFDTLAVRAHTYAADERMVEAAAPALLLTLVGLVPIVMLTRRLDRAAGAAR